MAQDFEQQVANDRPFEVKEISEGLFVVVPKGMDARDMKKHFDKKEEAETWAEFNNTLFQKGYWCGWDTMKPFLEEAMKLANMAYQMVPGVILQTKEQVEVIQAKDLKKRFEALLEKFPLKPKIILTGDQK